MDELKLKRADMLVAIGNEALVKTMRQKDMPTLVADYFKAIAELEELAQQAAPYMALRAAIERVWAERLVEQGGNTLPTGDARVDVHLEPGKKYMGTRDNRRLFELLTEWGRQNRVAFEEITKCVYQEKPREPGFSSDLTNLKALARKYGQPVQDIIDQCIGRPTYGQPTFAVGLTALGDDEYDDSN